MIVMGRNFREEPSERGLDPLVQGHYQACSVSVDAQVVIFLVGQRVARTVLVFWSSLISCMVRSNQGKQV